MSDFIWTVRVYYEDTDSSGMVYYANYLKFMERARTEWLRKHGFEQDVLRTDDKVLFVVRSVALEYHLPARFNDLLEVHSRISEIHGASMIFEQTILRKGNSEAALCSGRIKIACVDAAGFKPRRIPRRVLMEMAGGN